MLIMNDKILTATKQNLVKSKFLFIDKFYYTGPAVVRVMRDLTVRVSEHLEITSPMDVDKCINFMQQILRRPVLNRYKTVLV